MATPTLHFPGSRSFVSTPITHSKIQSLAKPSLIRTKNYYKSTTKLGVQPIKSRITASGNNATLECVNRFRDDWELVLADGKRLETNPSDLDKYLTAANIQSVQPQEALELLSKGHTLLDVRIQWSFDEFNLQDSVHIPIFRKIEGNSLAQSFRKAGFAAFGEIPPVERNFPDWIKGVEDKFPDRSTLLLVVCDIGGLLSENPTRRISSCSFEAMFYLLNCGYTNVRYVKGGMCAWRNNEELVARTPGVRGDLPWFKKISGIKEFFPAPCGWSYVANCACDDKEDQEANQQL